MPMREIETEVEGDSPIPAKGRRVTFVSLDEERRNQALVHALQGAAANLSPENVVVRAKVFETYMKLGN